jgi:uncharacterized repeat protein (TIGR01451 family)
VVAAADVEVSITDGAYDPVSTAQGTLVVFTVTVSNSGAGTAGNVVSTVTLPAELMGVSTTCAGGGTAVVCNVGTMAAGASVTYTVTAKVASATQVPAVVSTRVDATTTSADAVPSNNGATESTRLVGGSTVVALKVGVDDGQTVLTRGPPTNYTYVATGQNAVGGATATGVTVVQEIPQGFVIQGVPVASQGGGCIVVGQEVRCSLGSMNGGASATVSVMYVVGPTTAGGSATSTVVVAAAEPDADPSDNAAADTDTVAADVRVAVDDHVSTVVAGDGVSHVYTVTVTNGGPGVASGVAVATGLPAGVTGGGVSSSQGGCVALPCTIGTLGSGASAMILVAYTVDAGFRGPNVVYTPVVTSTTPDVNTTNNQDTDTDGVVVQVDLATEITSLAGPVAAGDTIVYTVGVTNKGPSTSVGATEVMTLPMGLTVVSAACGGATTTCALPNLAAGDSYEYTVTVQVGGSAAAGSVRERSKASSGRNRQ